MMTSRAIPPPTAVINPMAITPAKLKFASMAISAPEILKETRPMESLKIKSALFSKELRL